MITPVVRLSLIISITILTLFRLVRGVLSLLPFLLLVFMLNRWLHEILRLFLFWRGLSLNLRARHILCVLLALNVLPCASFVRCLS